MRIHEKEAIKKSITFLLALDSLTEMDWAEGYNIEKGINHSILSNEPCIGVRWFRGLIMQIQKEDDETLEEFEVRCHKEIDDATETPDAGECPRADRGALTLKDASGAVIDISKKIQDVIDRGMVESPTRMSSMPMLSEDKMSYVDKSGEDGTPYMLRSHNTYRDPMMTAVKPRYIHPDLGNVVIKQEEEEILDDEYFDGINEGKEPIREDDREETLEEKVLVCQHF